MTKAVLLLSSSTHYKDIPEERYHYPVRAYGRTMQRCVGDWIVYHETSRAGGRRAYLAVARVLRIEQDPVDVTRAYAIMGEYFDLAEPVGLRRSDGRHHESRLHQDDGSTNRGLRQRAVREISDDDFLAIVGAGCPAMDDSASDRPQRDLIKGDRLRRDPAFRAAVRRAYDSTCAFTDLRIVNGGGRAEVDAAHIRPVGDNHRGPDSVRNGLALSKTVHWLFDRGIVAVSDDYRILESPGRLPDRIRPLLRQDGVIRLPVRRSEWPAPTYLHYHRAMFEDEYGTFQPLRKQQDPAG